MKYQGGKGRISENITAEINNIASREGITNYYEPFCGGCSIGQKVNIQNRYLSDYNKYLIELLKKIQSDGNDANIWIDISEDTFNDVKENINTDKYEDWFTGYVGYSFSYHGKFMSSYNTVNESMGFRNNIIIEHKRLNNIQLNCGMYYNTDIKDGSIVYCDPPYVGTYGYTSQYTEGKICGWKCDKFNHHDYYKWCKEISKKNIVIMSEYFMPSKDFKIIGKFEVNSLMHMGGNKPKVSDNLYIVKDGWIVDKYYDDELDIGFE